jgi:hypothetical protein
MWRRRQLLLRGLPDDMKRTDEWKLLHGETLAEIIAGGDMCRHTMEAFWEQAVGVELAKCRYDNSFVVGFYKGALAVWESVREEVLAAS